MFGAAGLVVALVILAAAFWPSPTLDSYLAARACGPATTTEATDCTVTLPMTILDVSRSYGRGGNHYDYTLSNNGQVTTTRIDSFLVWIPRLRAGETVSAETWNGKVTRLSGAEGSYLTNDSPLKLREILERIAGFVAVAAWTPFVLAFLNSLRRSSV